MVGEQLLRDRRHGHEHQRVDKGSIGAASTTPRTASYAARTLDSARLNQMPTRRTPPPAAPTLSGIRHRRWRNSCRSPPATTGFKRRRPRSGSTWAPSNLPDECLNCRGTPVNNAIGDRISDLTADCRSILADDLVQYPDRRHRPHRRLLADRQHRRRDRRRTVATITDPNTSATPSAYSATINWGDGSSSAGTITGGNGTFNVVGSHSYATAGTFPVAVTITSVGHEPGQLDGERHGDDQRGTDNGCHRQRRPRSRALPPPSPARSTRAACRLPRSSSTGSTRSTPAVARSPTRSRRRRKRSAPTSPRTS